MSSVEIHLYSHNVPCLLCCVTCLPPTALIFCFPPFSLFFFGFVLFFVLDIRFPCFQWTTLLFKSVLWHTSALIPIQLCVNWCRPTWPVYDYECTEYDWCSQRYLAEKRLNLCWVGTNVSKDENQTRVKNKIKKERERERERAGGKEREKEQKLSKQKHACWPPSKMEIQSPSYSYRRLMTSKMIVMNRTFLTRDKAYW